LTRNLKQIHLVIYYSHGTQFYLWLTPLIPLIPSYFQNTKQSINKRNSATFKIGKIMNHTIQAKR